MMACVRSVRYQVRFNSEETDMFTPNKSSSPGGSPIPIFVPDLCKGFI
jgi:hypothetical protein